MLIEERSDPYFVSVRTANYSTNGYPSKIATLTRPSGTGVVALGHDGAMSARGIVLLPYGTGSSSNTFGVRVLGWRPTKPVDGGTAPTASLWVPVPLCTLAVTLGTGAGVAGADLGATTLFATTITCSYGPTWITAGASPVVPDWFQASPGSNDVACAFVRSMGFRFLEVVFTTGGSATDCNALYCLY